MVGLVLIGAGEHTKARAETPRNPPQTFSLDHRIPWTTSRVVGSPDPPPPYVATRAFPNLKFEQPVHLIKGPIAGRLFLVQLTGRIVSFLDDQSTAQIDPFLEPGFAQTYSMAFHPRFDENRFVYLFTNKGGEGQRGPSAFNRILRFEVSRDEPPRMLVETERLIIEYESNGHNGGELRFGPDGYLYISSGDGTGDSDGWNTGQDISDLTSGMIRIDVDHPDEGRNYGIPRDNPFLHIAGARLELWAYGFRNPWRFCFDPHSGELYVGDVGQDLWEMIWRVERGGNYGWSAQEGGHDFRPLGKRGPTPIRPPLVAHHHTEARSITGGLVYQGRRLAELEHAYLYGDFETGKIWGLRQKQGTINWHQELADTSLRPVSFEEGFDGRIYMLEHLKGEIYELSPAPVEQANLEFPRRLSDSGLFTSTRDLLPAPGLIPYEVNAPQWSDGAVAQRFIGVPGSAQITRSDAGSWTFPEGTVLVKTLSLPTETTQSSPPRRLETQILTLQQGQWYGYTYVWNDEQSDAELAPGAGMERMLTSLDAGADNPPLPPLGRGGKEGTWRVLSRTECMVCHSRAAGFVLGLSTEQMNRAHDYGQATENQLRALERLGMFTAPLTQAPEALGRFPDPHDVAADVAGRARAYLHANCAHCHVGAGGGNALITLSFATALMDTKLLGAAPLHGDFGVPGATLVTPLDPERSVLYLRAARRGRGQMPPLGTTKVDQQAVTLLNSWITGLEIPEEHRKEMDLAIAQSQGESGALARWYVMGPASSSELVELVQKTAVNGGSDADQILASAPWRSASAVGSELKVKLSAGASAASANAWLARAEVVLPGESAVQFLGASSGTIQVWLNGQLVYGRDQAQPFQAYGDRFSATLNQGANRLLVLVSSSDPAAEFSLSFRRQCSKPEQERLAELALAVDRGNLDHGRQVFFDANKGQCAKCHRVGNEGGQIGPDLTDVGDRYSRVRLIESVLDPSRTVAPHYKAVTAVLDDGRILSGVRVAEDADTLTLGDQEGATRVIPKSSIHELQSSPVSLMPDGLAQKLTDEEFVDLMAFLVQLTQPRGERPWQSGN